ncbi:MAG: radical SAM protein [Candidatus Nealsonbacteria bacterium]
MVWQSPPQIIQWDITSRCNLKCRHCRAANLDASTDDLSFDEVTSILKEIGSLAPDAYLALAGGEPLTRKDLKDILVFAKDNLKKISIELLTNATLVNRDNVGWLSELINGFNVSLDGASASVHDAIRNKGAFEKTVRGIKLLVEKKVRLAVRMTYLHQGLAEPERLMRFIADLGVKFFNFRYLVPVGRASRQKIDADEYEFLCRRIVYLGKKLGFEVGFSDPFPEILTDEKEAKKIRQDCLLMQGYAVTGCSAAFTLLYLDPKGTIQLCPYFPVEIADARKGNLNDIWFNNELLNLFRQHRGYLKGKCGDCEYKFACGGCRGAAWATGDFLGEDPRCWKK